jgi:MoxR-like ATPase
VKTLAPVVLAHRCIVHPESALRGISIERIIADTLEKTELSIGELEQ